MQYFHKLTIGLLRRYLLPLLPKKKRLPFTYWLYCSGDCENELIYLQKICQQRNTAIDIGANVGLYSYRLSLLFKKVYSFEINIELTEDLEVYNPGNIEIINTGLSSSEGEATLYIPVLNGHALTGWASLRAKNCLDTNQHIEKPVNIAKLDNFALQDISFIKIDVEGHEIEVLKGSSPKLVGEIMLIRGFAPMAHA